MGTNHCSSIYTLPGRRVQAVRVKTERENRFVYVLTAKKVSKVALTTDFANVRTVISSSTADCVFGGERLARCYGQLLKDGR
jgi:hypothetical protein